MCFVNTAKLIYMCDIMLGVEQKMISIPWAVRLNLLENVYSRPLLADDFELTHEVEAYVRLIKFLCAIGVHY